MRVTEGKNVELAWQAYEGDVVIQLNSSRLRTLNVVIPVAHRDSVASILQETRDSRRPIVDFDFSDFMPRADVEDTSPGDRFLIVPGRAQEALFAANVLYQTSVQMAPRKSVRDVTRNELGGQFVGHLSDVDNRKTWWIPAVTGQYLNENEYLWKELLQVTQGDGATVLITGIDEFAESTQNAFYKRMQALRRAGFANFFVFSKTMPSDLTHIYPFEKRFLEEYSPL